MTEFQFEVSVDGDSWAPISIISAEYVLRFNADPFLLVSQPNMWPSHPLQGVNNRNELIWIRPIRIN